MITDMTTSLPFSRPAARHRRQKSLKACRRQLGITQSVCCGARDICKCIVASVPEHLRVRLEGPPRSPRPLRSPGDEERTLARLRHNYPPAPGKKQRTGVVIEVQNSMVERNAGHPSGPRIQDRHPSRRCGRGERRRPDGRWGHYRGAEEAAQKGTRKSQ
jgi:hypothetical protein